MHEARIGRVLLLTGATGLVGSALLRRARRAREPVRCLVRDPRRLGPSGSACRSRSATSPTRASFRHALRGVAHRRPPRRLDRDQPHATIEELDGLATWRLLRAAEQAGVEHFVFFSALGADAAPPPRLHRAKALAERAVDDVGPARRRSSRPRSSTRPATAGWRGSSAWRWLPAVPLAGRGRARTQPIWADDVADCVRRRARRPPATAHGRFELAGPESLTHRQIVELALRAARPPPPARARARGRSCARCCAATRRSPARRRSRPGTRPSCWRRRCARARGTADAQALGVHPRRDGGRPRASPSADGPLGRSCRGRQRPRRASSCAATCEQRVLAQRLARPAGRRSAGRRRRSRPGSRSPAGR